MRTLLIAVLLAGCSMDGTDRGTPPAPGPALDAGRWQLLEIDGQPALEPAEGWIEVDLNASRISGSSGCNRFAVDFEGSPEQMAMGSVGATKMLCPEPLMAQERRVFEILGAAEKISVDGDGMLRITGGRGYLRAAPTI